MIHILKSFDRSLEDFDGLETEYLKVLYYDLAEHHKEKYKSYEYNRLCTIIEGEKHVKIGKEEAFTYDKSEFLLLPPHSTVDMEIMRPTQALVLELNSNLVHDINKKVSLELEVEVPTDDKLFRSTYEDLDFVNCLEKIVKLCTGDEKSKEFLIDLTAQELIYRLLKCEKTHHILTMESRNPLCKAINYMKSNLMNAFTVADLADMTNMSLASFSMKFKDITGLSTKDYLNNLKMVKAKELLKYGNVTEVAYDLGYQNISYFIKLFKNKYGVTPKQYQIGLLSGI